MEKLPIGIIGCGNISGIYLQNCSKMFRNLELVAVADQVRVRAEARAAEFGVPKVLGVDELLADPKIKAVLNLTIPKAHYAVCKAILESGKHAYVEKPLSTTLAEGEKLVDLARSKKLLLGSAPDTFLGAGIQTCKKLIDDGWLGQITGGSAFMLCGGHEGWHPDPEFYYQTGGGPLFDMGPYYLTALVALLGPVSRVCGMAKASFPERTIRSAGKFGTKIPVEVPTHTAGLLDFANGACVTLVTSFDVPGGSNHHPIEIWGSEGSLQVPDPNCFGGPVRYRRKGDANWSEIPLLFDHAENSRGLGLSDMARALSGGEPARASGDLALHVLEIMEGIHESSTRGMPLAMTHPCKRPRSME